MYKTSLNPIKPHLINTITNVNLFGAGVVLLLLHVRTGSHYEVLKLSLSPPTLASCTITPGSVEKF